MTTTRYILQQTSPNILLTKYFIHKIFNAKRQFYVNGASCLETFAVCIAHVTQQLMTTDYKVHG